MLKGNCVAFDPLVFQNRRTFRGKSQKVDKHTRTEGVILFGSFGTKSMDNMSPCALCLSKSMTLQLHYFTACLEFYGFLVMFNSMFWEHMKIWAFVSYKINVY